MQTHRRDSFHSHTRDSFRVLSYNLLADCYSRRWDEAGSVHAYCSPRLARAECRMSRLLDEVLAYSPDVALLQVGDWWEIGGRLVGAARIASGWPLDCFRTWLCCR